MRVSGLGKAKRYTQSRLAWCFAMVLCLVSCTSEIGGYIVPGESLDREGKYYVVVEEEDQRLLYLMLRENIARRGISVSSGSEDRIPQDADFLVEYGGQWVWDLAWYLFDFNVRIYDPDTRFLIASASSVRTSLKRRPPAQVVEETLGQLFDGSLPNRRN